MNRLRHLPLAFLLSLVLWILPVLGADLQVHFIDVGQGDSTLVITPSGKKLLVDAGIHATETDKRNPFNYMMRLKKKGEIVNRNIDFAIITHPHDDHYGGFAYLSKKKANQQDFVIPNIYYSVAPQPYGQYWKVIQVLVARSENHGQVSARGPPIELGDDIQVSVLYPPDKIETPSRNPNEDSVVIKLTFKNISFLLTGDAPSNVEEKVLGQDIRSTVLKVGHHGSKTSSCTDFLKAAAPSSSDFYAVISSNYNNGKGKTYGHPDKETLQSLKEVRGLKLYRTDLHGTIVFVTDGKTVNVRTEKQNISERDLWQPGKKVKKPQ